MFLKSMELSGFKSFADKTVLNFDEGITGIVGPNGCGKSNINDAIRWVLGEQSAKSLRSGSSMSDIIFAGSENRKPVNLARVTLVFDNTDRIFHSPFDEIEITREIRRNGDTACFLNKAPCRLKDISELVMDTGLGRDSLSIISQGNISSFADARPEERRLLFEEAAGVAKFKKRKKASLSHLENTQANLDRVQDLIDEISRRIEKLADQAAVAKEYMAYADELSTLEISVLTIQVEGWQNRLQEIQRQYREEAAQNALDSNSLNQKEELLEKLKREVLNLDQDVIHLQNSYNETREELFSVQRRKDQLDEKRKYALQAADAQVKAQSLKEMVADARFEYEDQQKKADQIQQDLQLQNRAVGTLANRLQETENEISNKNRQIQSLENEKIRLESRISAPMTYNEGVKAVLKAKDQISGMEGTVRDLLQSQSGYEAAISNALAGASDQIVTDSDASARRAIEWLKRNRKGRATFLPLSVCRPRYLQRHQLDTAMSIEGILGVAADFVSCDPRYEALKSRLLGNILIAADLKCANTAGNRLNHAVKIVTIDGDIVHAGGAMTGGYQKKNPLAQMRKDLDATVMALEAARADQLALIPKRQEFERLVEQEKERQIQLRINYEKQNTICQDKKGKYLSLYEEYGQLASMIKVAGDASESAGGPDSLVAQISQIQQKLDDTAALLQQKRQSKLEKNDQIGVLEQESRSLRRSMSSVQQDLHNLELEKARLETHCEEALLRLNSEYSLTYESALQRKQDVDLKKASSRLRQLKNAMKSLGDVNLNAPKELEEDTRKHDNLIQQKEQMESAIAKIREAISELDKTMVSQFSEMFEKINEQLDGVFKAMFGGGHARLAMTQPDDILNTGVDIDVQPPGKTVKNIQTFSGGEKALIAISVLFAILKARTMPLCIFDEVEAALDQANVERFARYLQYFKDQSQFIVVTHRPGTMEQCDTLYGITMQKNGVSQVLKVLLKDAAELAKEKE